jgi:biopolymer transport protein ExbD
MTSNRDDGEFGFQIAPMLDVLFVLLLFFMVAAGAQKNEKAIKVPLAGKGPERKVPVMLEIAEDGQVIFNGAATDAPSDAALPQTMSRLKATMADAPERPVIIEPAAATRHQRVMDVLDLCKAAHVQNVALSPVVD